MVVPKMKFLLTLGSNYIFTVLAIAGRFTMR